MKRQSVEAAYRDIRPDEGARQRMLENILSASSKIPPAGKDDTMNRKKMKPLWIAAIAAVMALLMGCAVVAYRLQDMKIGDWVSPGDTYVDESGTLVTEPNIEREVFSLQGYANSPGMLAAKEWYEFQQSYELNEERLKQAEQSGFEAPDMYDAYSCYTQEMIDKVDEIAEKYDLKLAGADATVQREYNHIFFDALGLERLHQENAPAEVEYSSGYFYACGNFQFSFHVNLNGSADTWPHKILTSLRYCDKEYLDVVTFTVKEISEMEQWTYRTTQGTDVFFAVSQDRGWIFCDREDAFLSVFFFPQQELEFGEVLRMSREDMELLADTIDFTIKPQKPDMGYVQQKIDEYEANRLGEFANKPAPDDEAQYQAFIRGRLEALEHPENLYYTKVDANGDGTVDLLLGTKDQLEVIWSVMDDENDGTRHLTFLVPPDDVMDAMNRSWPNMEIYPITEYPLD